MWLQTMSLLSLLCALSILVIPTVVHGLPRGGAQNDENGNRNRGYASENSSYLVDAGPWLGSGDNNNLRAAPSSRKLQILPTNPRRRRPTGPSTAPARPTSPPTESPSRSSVPSHSYNPTTDSPTDMVVVIEEISPNPSASQVSSAPTTTSRSSVPSYSYNSTTDSPTDIVVVMEEISSNPSASQVSSAPTITQALTFSTKSISLIVFTLESPSPFEEETDKLDDAVAAFLNVYFSARDPDFARILFDDYDVRRRLNDRKTLTYGLSYSGASALYRSDASAPISDANDILMDALSDSISSFKTFLEFALGNKSPELSRIVLRTPNHGI